MSQWRGKRKRGTKHSSDKAEMQVSREILDASNRAMPRPCRPVRVPASSNPTQEKKQPTTKKKKTKTQPKITTTKKRTQKKKKKKQTLDILVFLSSPSFFPFHLSVQVPISVNHLIQTDKQLRVENFLIQFFGACFFWSARTSQNLACQSSFFSRWECCPKVPEN